MSAKDEERKLAKVRRDASKAHNVATHQAEEAAAALADKRAELAAVTESNQQLQEQQFQETQVLPCRLEGPDGCSQDDVMLQAWSQFCP